MNDDRTAINLIDGHDRASLEVVREHDRLWVMCRLCGAQWAIHGAVAEQVSEGDGWCEENYGGI